MTTTPSNDRPGGNTRPTAAQQAAESPLLQVLVARYLRSGPAPEIDPVVPLGHVPFR
jgi:hypothetical protein